MPEALSRAPTAGTSCIRGGRPTLVGRDGSEDAFPGPGTIPGLQTQTIERGPRPRLRRRKVFAALGLVVVAFLLASSLLFVWPATDPPQRVDAILSLNGGNESAREGLSISLAKKGYARVLLFSQGNSHTTPCPEVPGVTVVCFSANPGRTVGEVEFATRYLHRHGLHSLLVVPGRAQVTRARLLMKRCYSGHVAYVAAPITLGQVPYDVVYEWGALAKALFLYRSC
jgi:hypothetical protein